MDLIMCNRKSQGDQPCHSGYRHGPISVAAVYSLRFWMVCGQVSARFLEREIDACADVMCSLWLQGVAVTLPSLTQEFGVSSTNVRFTTCALFIGLCVGATFWGIASDLVGRRLAFNLSLLICGVFGICVASSPNWIGYVFRADSSSQI